MFGRRKQRAQNPTEQRALERLAEIRADIANGVPAPPRTREEVLKTGWAQINAERAERDQQPQPPEPTVRALGDLTAHQVVSNPIAPPAVLSRLEALRTEIQVGQDMATLDQMRAAPPHQSLPGSNTHFGQ